MGVLLCRNNLLFFISAFLYWLLLSLMDRVIFLASVFHKIDDLQDVCLSFFYGLKLDISLSCYLMVLPFLFYILQQLVLKKPVSKWFLRIYTFLPTLLFALITVANVSLYEAWGEKISKRAIKLGLGTLGGVSNSLNFSIIIHIVLILSLYLIIAYLFYRFVVSKTAIFYKKSIRVTLLSLLIGSVVLFTFIRGGYGRATLNPSVAYFSDTNIHNHVAVNTYWAFIKDMMKSAKDNPFEFMDNELADQILKNVLPANDIEQTEILHTSRPNVVLVILEGVVSQVFEELGGEKGIMNGMGKLMKEGITFTRAYAAADRSDKGMIATLSGFPSQGAESIIQYIPKHEKLPAIGQLFDSLGYNTAFYHGGQSEFYNFKSYMFTHGIEHVIDNANFPIGTRRNSWGVYDHVLADQMLNDLDTTKRSFFNIFYTLVNHEPFDLDTKYQFGNDTKANAYRSTCYYTDTMLYNFVEKAKLKAWYENTIFIVVSDHGHVYPQEKYGMEHPERFHIPLFMFGGAIKNEYRGIKIDDVVSQLDIVSTLWSFVSRKPSPFKYSTGLFNKNRNNVAFFSSNSVFGVVNNKNSVSYDLIGRRIARSEITDKNNIQDSLLNLGKAYYQKVYQDFLNY